jgi:regulator of replication initiation timing
MDFAVETKIKRDLANIEKKVAMLDSLLSEKGITVKQLESENLKLKQENERLKTLIAFQFEQKSELARKLKKTNSGFSDDADLTEYARNLARQYAGRIRSDEN